MSFLLEEIKNSGFPGLGVLLLGVLGLLCGAAALIFLLMRDRSTRYIGAAAVVIGTLCALGGVGGTYWGRAMTRDAVASVGLDPIQRERITRVGYMEARSASRLGLACAALPMLAGALALLLGPRRPRSAAPGPFADMSRAAAPAPAPDEGGGLALPAILLSVAGLSAASAVAVVGAPLPGRDESELAPLIEEAERREREERARAEQQQTAPEPLAEPSSEPSPEPSPEPAPHASAEPTPTPERPGGASAADAKGKTAGVNAGASQVSGRLPPEVIRRVVQRHMASIRLCYEQGLKRNPELAGKVTVRFVIGPDGSVSTASASQSDIGDPAVVACVVQRVRRMAFPQPEGGIVTVSYPFMFKAA